METQEFKGNIVDLTNGKIFKGRLLVENGKIKSIAKDNSVTEDHFILPGLIDSHIHIESSMLIPSEFARLAVTHGTVATVSDPHEIANVLGIDGIKYMIVNGNSVPFKLFFGASSCVPATPFETAGNKIGIEELEELLSMDQIKYLSEMMNFPGVINRDEFEMQKLDVAKKHGKPADGHAPGVKGEAAKKYIEAGITTDHECFTIEEALEKIKYGMNIQIREGSAAKNFEALADLIGSHPDKVLFCSDDKHPDDLLEGHINDMYKRAISKGYDPLRVLQSIVLNPINHYKLDVGILRENDDADFIIVDNLDNFNIKKTYIKGEMVFDGKQCLINSVRGDTPNKFIAKKIEKSQIQVPYTSGKLKVIKAFDGELITSKLEVNPKINKGNVESDTENDILKLVVLNRYGISEPSMAFINGFGFKEGAIASSVAHDSHNVVAVGTNDDDLIEAINKVIENKGGVVAISNNETKVLPLPVAGLMSNIDAYQVAEQYQSIDKLAHKMGSKLRAPFMTLSFMALLVIPNLKLSDKGLFDGTTFSFTPMFN
ncbi:MAG: adenine deaminase [Marinilabiliales bacterium]|nr:MAG: adenine deaminase [Marinilabiliales bacterium]